MPTYIDLILEVLRSFPAKTGFRTRVAGLAGLLFCLLTPAGLAQTNLSVWVHPGSSGRMLYQPDAQGNHIVDNSGVGYMGGTVPLPVVPTVMTISPVAGDNTANVQGALDAMAALTPGSNGFRGALLLTAGYYAISNSVSINASGIVLRGVGNTTNDTVIYCTSTNGPNNGDGAKFQVQGVVVISGSYSPIPVNGTSNTIIDNYVPVGARSFTVDGAGVLNVGDLVIVHRPSTANWITEIGMDELSTPWEPGTVDVDEERVITRIEGNRVMIDQPITTALDQNYGGGGVYAFTWPQRYTNIGVEDLRGQSYYDGDTNDEDHAWTFLRFSDTANLWVRNVVSQYFGKSLVSIQEGCKYATVVNCQCLNPISLIESERRYAFDINSCQLCLVKNCYTLQDRHSFLTESLTDGPNVFVDGLAQQAYDLAGPHVMWASGILFDNITTDNGMTCANVGNAGAAGDPGQGWTGANCAFWNCNAGAVTNGFTIEGPPTAHNWLIGGIGPLVAGGSGNAGPDGPGTYDSLGTNVFPNSLYYAQLQDLIAAPYLQTREYRLGAINLFTSNTPVPLDPTWSNTVMAAAAGKPLNGFDVVTNGQWVPFTFDFQLSSGDQIVAATLTISMLAAGNNDTNDVLYLGSLSNSFLFSDLGWLPVSTVGTNPTVVVLDLSQQLNLLTNGELNVAVQSDAAVDWALLQLEVAPALATFTNALLPVGDATVQAGIYATNNFGETTTFTTDNTTLTNDQQQAYLSWNLSGVTGQILQARVQLVPVDVAGGGIEQGVAFAETNDWDESTITWDNQPGISNRFATWIPTQNVPVQFVIPPQMMDTVAAQNNQLCLALYSIHDVGVLGSVSYASSKYPNPALRPQLFLIISNTAPSISGLTNVMIFQDTSTGPLPFNISDAESPNGNLVLSAFSANANLVPNQNMVFGSGGSEPTFTVTPAPGQTGSAAIAVIVTDPGGLTATNNFTLTVAPYTNASFVVAATPGVQSEPAGGGASFNVSVTETNGSFTNDVALSVSGLPVGAVAGFTPPSVSGSGSSTLSVTTATNTPGGTYLLTIVGAGGGLTRSTTITLNVAGYLFSATPASQNVATNGATTFNLGLIYTNDYNGNLSFSVAGLPAGTTAAFNPTSLGGSGGSILTVTASASTPPGIYPLAITATDGTLAQTADVLLNVFAFSLSAIPGTQTVTTSAGINYTITVAGTPGVSNVVAMSVSGLPAGAVAGFLPATLTGSGQTTLSIGTALTTPPGVYTLTISGSSGSLTNSTTVMMTVTDFGFSTTPAAQTVLAGNGTNFTTTVSAINGFADEVDFNVTGLPSGAIASFSPAFVDGPGAATLSVTTTTNTPAGSYVLTITGTDGTLVHSATVTLHVAGFTLASSPTSRTVTSGSTPNSFTITVTATNGFTGDVLLAVSGLPTGVNATFNPTNVNGSGTSTLSLTTSDSTPAGVYPLTVTATSGNLVLTTSPTLKVNNFSIAASPTVQNVLAGVGTSYAVTITSNNGFSGVVGLSVSGQPTGVGASFSPVSLTNAGSSTLNVTTANTTAGGSYILTITGTSGSLALSTNVTLNVTGLTNSFALNTTPTALTISPGGSNNFTSAIVGSSGFTNTVALTVSGMPAGVNAVFSPASVTNGNGSSQLSVTASNSVTAGIYPLTIIGTSGSITQTNTVTLNIFSFTLAAAPQSRTIVASAGDDFTVTATGTTGISNNVTLSVSGLPSGAGASFSNSPMVVTNTGSSTLNVTTATNTPYGDYVLTITAVFEALTNTANVTLKVTDFSIAATPASQTVMAGEGTNFTVTITSLNKFATNSNVAFTDSGLPAGVSSVFSPTSVDGTGGATLTNSTLTITTVGTTPGGTYTVTINGISGAQTHSTNVTFIVTGTPTPPVLAPVSNQVVNPDVTLTITNVATDSNVPPPTLTFSLPTAPSGASINTSNGIFTWRPPLAQSNTTNLTTVKVTDNNTPPLSATQSFNIMVNTVTLPTLTALGLTNGALTLRLSGSNGPDVTMQASTNLTNWAALFMTNSPVLPFTWTDTNASNFSSRFYRALLGP